jgi:hypothetical protein
VLTSSGASQFRRHVQEKQRLLWQYLSNVINIKTKTNKSFNDTVADIFDSEAK